MAAHEKMLTYRLLFATVFVACGIKASQISNIKLCADKNCKETISKATALARYPASSPLHLSFNRGDVIEIKSKSAGTRPELWSGELDGRTGYFPRGFVKEYEVIHNSPTFEVPTEESEWVKKSQHIPLSAASLKSSSESRKTEAKLGVEKGTESEKDETEIEENTLIRDGAATHESASSVVNQPIVDIPPESRTVQSEDETEIEEGDAAAGNHDLLLRDIKELQKSIMKSNEMLQDTKVFNEFLAKRFGTFDAESSSEKVKQDEVTEGKSPKRDMGKSEQGIPSVAAHVGKSEQDHVSPDAHASKSEQDSLFSHEVDETEVEEGFEPLLGGAGEAFKDADHHHRRMPKSGEDEITDKDQNSAVSNPGKIETDSPYIDGIMPLEVEDTDDSEDAEVNDVKTEPGSDKGTRAYEEDDDNTSETGKETGSRGLKGSEDNLSEDAERRDLQTPQTKEASKSSEKDTDSLERKDLEPDVDRIQNVHESENRVAKVTIDILDTPSGTVGSLSAEEDKSSTPLIARKDFEHEAANQSTRGDQHVEQEADTFVKHVFNKEGNAAVHHMHAESSAKERTDMREEGNKKQDILTGGNAVRQSVDPDFTGKESSAQTAKAYQPVDIDFMHGEERIRNLDLGLESSQTFTLPKQGSQTETPMLTASSRHYTKPTETDDARSVEKTDSLISTMEEGEKILTTVIDGTTFLLGDDGIMDVIAESNHVVDVGVPATTVMIVPPEKTSAVVEVEPSVAPLTEEIPARELPNIPAPNSVQAGAQQDFHANQSSTGSIPLEEKTGEAEFDKPQPSTGEEQYGTNADFLGRKVLSLEQSGTYTPPRAEGDHHGATNTVKKVEMQGEPEVTLALKRAQPGFMEDSVPAETLASPGTVASQILLTPRVMPDSSSTVVTGMQLHHKEDEQRSEPQSELFQPRVHESASSEEEKAMDQPAPTPEMVTHPSDGQYLDGLPLPPTADEVTWAPAGDNVHDQEPVVPEEPTLESDAYQMDDYYSRKITDEDLAKVEEELAAYASGSSPTSVISALEGHSKALIDKLPPSIQSLLEQEPLGLSPAVTVLVTMTTFLAVFFTTCFSCICTTRSKKSGKKDPLVVVHELEEKLLMAVKEKENLEDLLQEHLSEGSRLKDDLKILQSSSGSSETELQNVKLHNEALKSQVTTLQSEIAELKKRMSQRSDDVKVKDKKTKELEKELKKSEECIKKLEQEAEKKEEGRLALEHKNKDLNSNVQALTDRLQQLETSKQQLLLEASDWKEKVEEMKERLDQLEVENRQAQETLSFKDNELEVMKDCYLQLKAFEKESVDGVEEFDPASSSDIQDKIQAMMDVSRVNATLRAVQEEKDNLENKLKIENDSRHELEEQLECVRREAESCMADKMKAERQCQEAQTKLSVLSTYFKEKEVQLQRELGEHEALRKQNLSKLDSADETTRTMQKELDLSKQQVESLKRELAASERDFRAQIAANEKKAHENWLNARAAERELKEARHEAAVLRQKLTEGERRQMGPGGLIRPLPTRGMPLPGMLNGPPPPPHPGMERSPSRGSLPPGPPPPPFSRDDDYNLSPRERQRLPPSHPALHMPPPPDTRPPGPRMPPPETRSPPLRMPPPDARSPPPRIPPPYDRRGPPHPLDRASPPLRMPPPEMRGHFPPHIRSPPPRSDSPRDTRPGPASYGRSGAGSEKRHHSQV